MELQSVNRALQWASWKESFQEFARENILHRKSSLIGIPNIQRCL